MNHTLQIEKLSCHCKEVQIELKLEKDLEELVRCNCSLCKRRGSIMSKIKLENLKITKGADKLTLYKFGKKIMLNIFSVQFVGSILTIDRIQTLKTMNLMLLA